MPNVFRQVERPSDVRYRQDARRCVGEAGAGGQISNDGVFVLAVGQKAGFPSSWPARPSTIRTNVVTYTAMRGAARVTPLVPGAVHWPSLRPCACVRSPRRLLAWSRPCLEPPKRSHARTCASPAAAALRAPTASPHGLRDWEGLAAWRRAPQDERWTWTDQGPTVPAPGECTPAGGAWLQAPSPNTSLAVCAREVLAAADPWEKIARAHGAFAALNNGLPIGTAVLWSGPPARPSKPRLVPAREVPGPKEAGLPLNAYMLHNLAHIELNAIDLAMDTVLRFCHYPMPRAFFADFARVADEEARHLGWCLQRMAELGRAYGDMPAHGLLWAGCEASGGDVRARLAVVPMSQEARGLDAGPRLVERLVGAGDHRTAAVVARIAAEEVAHVAVGASWFRRVCAAQGRDPSTVFRTVLSTVDLDLFRGSLNHEARATAGLERHWYDPAPTLRVAGGKGRGAGANARGVAVGGVREGVVGGASGGAGGAVGGASGGGSGMAVDEDGDAVTCGLERMSEEEVAELGRVLQAWCAFEEGAGAGEVS